MGTHGQDFGLQETVSKLALGISKRLNKCLSWEENKKEGREGKIKKRNGTADKISQRK